METPETDTQEAGTQDADALETTDEASAGPPSSDEKPPLNLEFSIENRGACGRHITVTIPRVDIDRYFKDAFDELLPKAEVPGFRPGRAPRKLVESKFRDRMSDQVKGSLLMDSVTQVTEDGEFSAISEPDFDFEAIELPKEGPLTFEFNIEVRPEFDVPEWTGLKLERPVHEYTDAEVDAHTKRLLERHASPTPKDEPAEQGDLVGFDLTVRNGEKLVANMVVDAVHIRPNLSFPDANLNEFDKLMLGARPGDRKTAKIAISDEAEDEELRGQQLDAEIVIRKVMGISLPDLNASLLEKLGGFESVEELRDAVREELERHSEHQQQQRIREQITTILLKDAKWELPKDLLRRQASRELDRAVLELRTAGYGDDVIRAHENQIRQNSLATTARALKEHFILERIAEDKGLDVAPDDFDIAIRLIAAQSQESPRRVRARMEKRGQMDALRNQILERKVIDMIVADAEFTEVPLAMRVDDTTAVDQAVLGQPQNESAIPEAKYANEVTEDRPQTK